MKRLKLKTKVLLILLVLVSLVFGNYQEKVKLSLNNVINYSQQIPNYDELGEEVREKYVDEIIAGRPIDFFNSQNSFANFYHYNLKGLQRLKWILAFAFIAVFFIFNSTILWLAFKNKDLIKFLAMVYAIISIVAICFYGLGAATGKNLEGYGVARKMLGSLQSLIPVMLLVPAYLIFDKSNQTK